MNKKDQLAINTIRFLAVDAINKAKSGHPGICLGMAPSIYNLYTKVMNVNPENPSWFNRDRFVLSAGHGSAMLYATLHLSGYKISLKDLQNFRQFNSITPGHPEVDVTPGVDMGTGPLGQGISTAVGMALAEKWLANHFNKDDMKVIDHYTYVICGDGDLQEGIVQEALSIAGHYELSKLIILYDSNNIQLEGPTSLAYSDNIKARMESLNFNYLRVNDGNKIDDVYKAINKAKAQNKPTLIEVKTIIGYGAPNQGTNSVHGSPLGEEKTDVLRQVLGYTYKPFEVSKSVRYTFKCVKENGSTKEAEWNKLVKDYQEKYPNEGKELVHFINNDYQIDEDKLPKFEVGSSEATRNISGKLFTEISKQVPNLLGGSADLSSSTKIKGVEGNINAQDFNGRNVNYGVREHAMAAINNGIYLHGGLKSAISCFFVFSDYLKPSLRLSSLMEIPTISFFSHDSICVGEDGPTHEPIEQATMLRSIPNFDVYRPADANETLAAIEVALYSKKTPTAILTTRQNLPMLKETSVDLAKRGAYVASYEKKNCDGIIIASGSELYLALEAKEELFAKGIDVRIVSMPSMFMFELQDKKYQESVLPKAISKRLAVEAGHPMPYYKYASNVIGISTFGKSAPYKELLTYFGITKENIVKTYLEI